MMMTLRTIFERLERWGQQPKNYLGLCLVLAFLLGAVVMGCVLLFIGAD